MFFFSPSICYHEHAYMKSRHLSWFLALFILFIGGVNALADSFHLYFLILWFDIPMHIMGGLWVGLTSLVIHYHTDWIKRKDRSASFVIAAALSATLVVGLLWEVFEYSVEHLVKLNDNGLADTLKDLVDDMIGAVIASVIFIRKGYNKII